MYKINSLILILIWILKIDFQCLNVCWISSSFNEPRILKFCNSKNYFLIFRTSSYIPKGRNKILLSMALMTSTYLDKVINYLIPVFQVWKKFLIRWITWDLFVITDPLGVNHYLFFKAFRWHTKNRFKSWLKLLIYNG